MDIVTKICIWCKLEKKIFEFGKNKDTSTGISNVCKVCWRNYQHEWKLKHPEKYVEHYKKSNKKAYETRKTKIDKYNREWAKKNKKRYSEIIRNAHNKYTKAHPEKARELSRNRRALVKQSTGKISAKEEKELFEKYGNKCLCCKKGNVKLALDHIVPLVRGGLNVIDNAQPLCTSCNSRKGTKTIDFRPFA